jgi:hypothetical protein
VLYNGIKLIFEQQNNQDEFSGECEYEFNLAATNFIKSHYDRDELPNLLEDNLSGHDFDDVGGDCIFSNSADEFILLMNALEYSTSENEGFEIVCRYDHIIWLFHDLSHVAHDGTDEDIYVEAWTEQNAIKRSIELCIENGIAVPWDTIRKTEGEYLERFETELDLGEIEQPTVNTENFTFEKLAA